MAPGKRRAILRLIAVLVLLIVVLVIALPIWFPWLLRPAANRMDLSYDRYERQGYNRFQLEAVTLHTSGGVFRAEQAESFIPTTWLWRAFTGKETDPFLAIRSWEFVAQPGDTNATAEPSSLHTNISKLRDTLDTLRRWAPAAVLTNGSIQLNNLSVGIPNAVWSNGHLVAQIVLPENRRFLVKAIYRRDAPLDLSIESPDLSMAARASLQTVAAGLEIAGTAAWRTNRIEWNAAFARTGALPDSAHIEAESFSIPADLLRLDEYREVTGSLSADWTTNRFDLDLTARAVPETTAAVPPIALEAHASGDAHSVRIDTARITSPWLDASLSSGTVIRFQPPYLTTPAGLNLSADLSQQPWLAATGHLEGTALLLPTNAPYPQITFVLTGNNIVVSNIAAESLRLQGRLDWPQLTLAPAQVRMADGSELLLTGAVNLAEQTISGGRLHYAGTFGRQFLPEGYAFEQATLQAQFSGPFSTLEHSGSAGVATLQAPGTRPMHVTAEWIGRGTQFRQLTLQAAASNAFIRLRGSADAGGDVKQLTASELTLHTPRHGELRLQNPFALSFRVAPEQTNAGPAWTMRLDPAHWMADDRELYLAGDAAWPDQGTFAVRARNLPGDLFNDFVQSAASNVVVHGLDLRGGWTNGPVLFDLDATAGIDTGTPFDFAVAAHLIGASNSLSIDRFSISTATQLVVSAEGELPVSLRPAATGDVVRVQSDGLLRLTVFTETNSVLWDELAERTGVRVRQPTVAVDLTGTWQRPEGHVTVQARQIQFAGMDRPMPAVEHFDFAADLTREGGLNSELNARLEGQPVHLTAKVPLEDEFWIGLGRGRYVPDWRKATVHLTISEADIAAFSAFAPELLTPQGEVTLDVRFENGRLSGEALIEDARTRPLATFGPLRNIHARVLFADERLSLTNMTVEIGGLPVRAYGTARLADGFWRAEGLPPFELHLHGTNVPLVRRADVVLRADLNVAITNTAGTNAVIGGVVRLRDSFYLSDLQDLVPGRVATPKRRPPYFSVETEPFAGWRLALQVQGEQFLRVRSPLFRGIVSATVQLEGPLKEPTALGEVRIHSGSVTFPFGTLDVQQGFISMTSADPHRPQLFITAASQRMGYDIRMEATGPADAPVIQFSSSPPLSSEEIVLMLTTGQMPRGTAATSAQQRAQGLALFVGKNLLSDFGFGGTGDERLTMRSGEELTESGRPTYEVQYKLADDWSLVGEYDRFSQYNLGVKWRVYSK